MTRTMINPGKYRHPIVLQSPLNDSTRDTFGRRTGTPVSGISVYAEKTDWTGDESREGGRETASVVTRFRIRYREGISTTMQVIDGNDVYDILSVLDFDGTRRELTLNCRKVVNE